MDGTYSNFSDYPLKDIPAPHAHDVLCGRGGGTNNHVGNNHWRALVAANKQLYITLPKRQKMLLSKSIVNAVRSQNPPGRFLQKDSSTSTWFDVGDHKATEKTSQALREGAPTIRINMDSKEGDRQDGEKSSSTEKSTKASTAKKKKTPKASIVPSYLPSTNVNPDAAKAGAPATPNNPMQANMPPPAAPPAPPNQSPGMMGSPAMGSGGMYPTYNMPQNNYPPSMVPSMQPGMPPNAQAYHHPQVLRPQVPPPVSSHAPQGDHTKQTGRRKRADPSASTGTSKDSSNRNQDLSQPHPQSQSDPNESSRTSGHGTSNPRTGSSNVEEPSIQFPIKNFDAAAAAAAESVVPEPVGGGLVKDPGYSFGSISMTSAEHHLLQPTGTSFGEQSQALASIASYEPDPIWEPAQFANNRNNSNGGVPPPHGPHTFGTKSRANLLECSDTESEDEGPQGVPAPQCSQEWEKMQMKLGARIRSTDNPAPVAAVASPPSNIEPDEPVPTELGERDISCMSALSVMSLEPLNPSTSRSISKVIASMGGDAVQATELGRDVSNAFSEMSYSRDGSDTIGTIDKHFDKHYFEPPPPPREVMGPPPNVVKNSQEGKEQGREMTEQEKLEIMYLQRGASLAFEPFGSANNQYR